MGILQVYWSLWRQLNVKDWCGEAVLREYSRGSLTSHPVPLTGATLRAGRARTGGTPTAGSLESRVHGNTQVWVTVAMVGHKENVEFNISIVED